MRLCQRPGSRRGAAGAEGRPNALEDGAWNALHAAAYHGNVKNVTMLLSKGVILEALSAFGLAALLITGES